MKEKIKGSEFFAEVKVPEYTDKLNRPFCCEEHADFYKMYVKGTPCATCMMR